MAIKSHQESIERLFSERRRYVIPDYQRPYVWDFDQAQDLAEDLLAAWHRKDTDFFLGSIVLIREEGAAVGEVVDGQQRLTTLAILFSVLREFTSGPIASAITAYLKTDADVIRGVGASPRVQVREIDREFFNAHFVEGDLAGLREQHTNALPTEGQRNMRRSSDAIWETLSDLEDPQELLDFVQFVLAVSVIVIETDNFQNAHRIFGVLNTRGVPLAASDVFKAQILGSISEEQREAYAEKWDEALMSVEADPDAFFRHLLVSQKRAPLRRSLAEEFDTQITQRLLPDVGGERFIDDFLAPLSAAFDTVSNSLNDDVAEVLDLLHDHHSGDWKPVAMWVLTNVDDQHERDRLLRGIDRVFGVHTLAGSNRTRRVEAMTDLLQRFENSLHVGASLPGNEIFAIPDPLIYSAHAALHGQLPRSAKRVTLLRRAHWEATGAAGLLDPESTWISVFPANPLPEVNDDALAELWASKLGSMVLSTTNNARVRRSTTWQELCLLTAPTNEAQRSIVTTLDPAQPPTRRALEQRHRQMVQLVTEHWGIAKDSAGMDLLSLDESHILQLAGRGRVTRSRPTRLSDVFQLGLLSPGDRLRWVRKNLGQQFEVTVTEDGQLELPNGQRVSSPSAAAKQLSGSSVQALDVWHRVSDNVALRTLWDRYEERFTQDPPAVSPKTAPSTTPAPKTAQPPPVQKTVRPSVPEGLNVGLRQKDPVQVAQAEQPVELPDLHSEDVQRVGSAWTWVTQANQNLLRRRSSSLPPSVAAALNVGPASSRTFVTRGGEQVAIRWDGDGPTIGDVRRLLIRSEIIRGDLVRFRFGDEGTVTAHRVLKDEDSDLQANNQLLSNKSAGVNSPSDVLAVAAQRARAVGAEVDDQRSNGGALWIHDHPRIDGIIRDANDNGAFFRHASRRKKGASGWWAKG